MPEINYSITSLRICIDEVGENTRGTIQGVALEESIPFCTLAELVLRVDDAYNAIGQPQPSEVLRSFREDAPKYNPYVPFPKRYHSGEEIAARTGRVDTFDLIVTTRRNAEWQGMIKNTDGTAAGSFSTVMECLNCIEKHLF